jgi:hypothetical protein
MRFLTNLFLSGAILFAQTSNSSIATDPPTGQLQHSMEGSSGRPSKGTMPSSCGTRCGAERWPLKTLTDAEASIIPECHCHRNYCFEVGI